MAWIGDTLACELRQETLARIGWALGFMTLLFGVVGSLLYADWRRQQAMPVVAAASTGPVGRPGFEWRFRPFIFTWRATHTMASGQGYLFCSNLAPHCFNSICHGHRVAQD
jgi:hypothetical protein